MHWRGRALWFQLKPLNCSHLRLPDWLTAVSPYRLHGRAECGGLLLAELLQSAHVFVLFLPRHLSIHLDVLVDDHAEIRLLLLRGIWVHTG